MWSKVKWFFGVLGWIILAVLVGIKAFLFKDRSKDVSVPAHPTAEDLLERQKEKVAEKNKKMEEIRSKVKEDSDEKDVSDLIDDYNDLYND